MFSVVEIVCTVLNTLAVIVDLTVHKWYRLFKKKVKNFEIFEWIVGICSSAVTFLLTIIISTVAIINGNQESNISPAIVGWVELFTCVVITGIHFIIEFKSFYRNEIDKRNYKSYDGVFAVSAIIVTADNKLLLMTRKRDGSTSEEIWVQPGVYYRTNTLHKNPLPLKPFYNHLIESIEFECGLTKDKYEIIQLSSMIAQEQETFAESGLTTWSAKYNQNQLSPTPFLIQIEKADVQKRSGTNRHIDCFYAFKLKIDDDKELLESIMRATTSKAKYEKLCTFTYEEVMQMCKPEGLHKDSAINRCYPDLSIIMKKFFIAWRRELFLKKFENNIRHCTFNPNNNTIWVRINENCNLNCEFCLMVTKNAKIQTISWNSERFFAFWNSLKLFDGQKSYHLVITGGEPLLVKGLYELISYMDNNSNGKIGSITICTNGTLGTSKLKSAYSQNAIENLQNLLSDTCHFKNKCKYVINMSSYNEDSFCAITHAKSSDLFQQQSEFIKYLHLQNMYDITANIVMTDILKKHLAEYFLLWKNSQIKKVAFSYSIQLGINSRGGMKHIRTLTKDECVKLFNSLGNGEYEIELFDSIELMIPSCDEKKSCKENQNIISLFMTSNKEWISKTGCLDI